MPRSPSGMMRLLRQRHVVDLSTMYPVEVGSVTWTCRRYAVAIVFGVLPLFSVACEQDAETARHDAAAPAATVTEEIQTTPPTATSSRPKPRWHGDFALFPAGTLYESIDLEPGAVPEALARVEITSEDIERYASFGDVPADVRDEARSPDYIPAGVQLDSVRVLAEGGSLLQSTALWFNDSTFRRDLAHADLAVTRTLAMQPPVVVVLPGPQPDGGAIQSWTISEVFVAAHPALYHDFTNNRDADRVERQADALQWFDEEGYFNVVIAWNLSFDEMRKVAESIGPSPTRIRQRTPGRTPTATEGARPEWKGRPILGRPFAHTWSG